MTKGDALGELFIKSSPNPSKISIKSFFTFIIKMW